MTAIFVGKGWPAAYEPNKWSNSCEVCAGGGGLAPWDVVDLYTVAATGGWSYWRGGSG
ncbi:hypothetical protein FC50_GL000711 [Lacticaseibacillus pantheris DSM 15945 = JCM 12539 = NBRC 106106]|uniref:Uncharacterized protein n=1 Tax=Lacticaseibacillus pantheris DSM 15945 = JCM 12539 = NBRC 106106 TaxID=1423783 RepID=A0A0R1TZ56_9LACO|nr:hypothetical protein FC50_GL000711 [Lacticaseibacillus pantheris DSM 15945 = JCM 12539 = NBRC 106106]